jgi:hypothetical protein
MSSSVRTKNERDPRDERRDDDEKSFAVRPQNEHIRTLGIETRIRQVGEGASSDDRIAV